MKPLKVGIVGVGRSGDGGSRRGRGHIRVFQANKYTEVTAICDKSEAALEETGTEFSIADKDWYTDYEKFLEQDVNIVVLSTPVPVHVEQAIAALESGKHVLSEVPAAYSLEECEKLVKTVQQTGKKYMLAENFRFAAFIESWKKLIEVGRIGKIIYAEAEYVHDCRALMRDDKGNKTWRASLPPIHYCTHSLGPLLYLMEDRCVSVTGLHSGCNVAPELGAIDMEVGIFKLTSGAVVKILCGFSIVREPAFLYFSVYGTKGCLENSREGAARTLAYFEDTPNLHGMIHLPLDTVHTHVPLEARLGGHGTSEYFMVQGFIDCILNDTQPPINIYDAMDYTVPGICAHISAQSNGKLIEIPSYR